MNNKNKELYEEYMAFHTNDGGKFPEEYALTELIKKNIEDKSYRVYRGGGYSITSNDYTKDVQTDIFDVVVWFSLPGDPYFFVCKDNSEGDLCDLYRCDTKGNMLMLRK